MKAFISHSWKNKTIAQKIADELKASGVELWVDANNLLPGQVIQDTIDKVIGGIDVVVLVWTKEANKSKGVAAEIFTCSQLKKLVIPCKIDDTSLEKFPYIQQIKGIGFQDFDSGVGRLKMVLLNYMTKDFDMQNNESIKMMNEFMGTLETANHLIYKEKIKNAGTKEEKDFWIKKIEDTYSVSYHKLKEEETIGKEVTAFLNEKMNELQSGLNDRNKVSKVLNEMKISKYASRPDMKKFIDQVEKIYKSFDVQHTDAIVNFKKEMTTKLENSKQQLKNSMGWLADMLFTAAFENVSYFFLSSPDHLEKLLELSKQQGVHPVVEDCANELLQYIKTPGGVIDNNQYGILGYSDDAYLIHGLLATLQQEGIIDTSQWNIDWNKIGTGAEFVFNLVGIQIKNTLDQNIYNFCQAMVKKYSPQQSTTPQPQTYQQQVNDLQKAKDDLWKAKLMSLQTSMIQSPVY